MCSGVCVHTSFCLYESDRVEVYRALVISLLSH